ncbi:hypothetical protein HPB50_004523 [Hyalomma asiaticum]|uniref:Uncharacterized protein n=1 Tax=Hyalomma asiaticum TaxID=266040 RepID=A0ACB7RRU7_HYAAI|nr:hypothetical protein HPB50_004523 [Hyalomma asiaticum]
MKTSKPPHIIFILADDLGWNDVSFHGSRQIPTPNIDALAAHGVILLRHYATPVCTPSRVAFLTARNPPSVGMDYVPLPQAAKSALPTNIELLPQWLKRLGYSTHMIGKWHLGYKSHEYTPTWRGFDTFFGYYNGLEYYFNHSIDSSGHCGLDFWRNEGHTTQAVTDLDGTYSTYAFADEAKRIISDHDPEKPLFLYLSYQAVHSSCQDCIVEAPEEVVNSFSYIEAYNRSVYAAALHLMDRSIGDVLAALQSRGMLADSIVVFASDNGAAPLKDITAANAGSNWPLRGVKSTVWEGGARTPAVFWYGRLSDRLPLPPSQQMVHITDWAPTFYAAAAEVAKRTVVIFPRCGTFRYKLISRPLSESDPLTDSRVPPPKGQPPEDVDLDAAMQSSDAWKALQQASRDIGSSGRSVPTKNWRQEATVKCNGQATSGDDQDVAGNFDRDDTVFVFDVFNDPCELNNLASSEPQLRDKLLKKLAAYRTQFPSHLQGMKIDDRGYAEYHHCTWSTWLDVEETEYQNCPC